MLKAFWESQFVFWKLSIYKALVASETMLLSVNDGHSSHQTASQSREGANLLSRVIVLSIWLSYFHFFPFLWAQSISPVGSLMGENFGRLCSGISPNQTVDLTCGDNLTCSHCTEQMAWNANLMNPSGCSYFLEVQGLLGSLRTLIPEGRVWPTKW